MFTNQVRRVTNSDRINVSLESRRAAKNGMVSRELAMPAPEAVHLVPKDTSPDPVDVSIVVPALNEALVIGRDDVWPSLRQLLQPANVQIKTIQGKHLQEP